MCLGTFSRRARSHLRHFPIARVRIPAEHFLLQIVSLLRNSHNLPHNSHFRGVSHHFMLIAGRVINSCIRLYASITRIMTFNTVIKKSINTWCLKIIPHMTPYGGIIRIRLRVEAFLPLSRPSGSPVSVMYRILALYKRIVNQHDKLIRI